MIRAKFLTTFVFFCDISTNYNNSNNKPSKLVIALVMKLTAVLSTTAMPLVSRAETPQCTGTSVCSPQLLHSRAEDGIHNCPDKRQTADKPVGNPIEYAVSHRNKRQSKACDKRTKGAE